jgi:YD repeat-containing protein
VAGTDATEASMYGNGWTSTFDAHLSGSSTGTISVWDIDGARYDYTLAADGVTRIPPPGQYATLVSDGGCGFLWTKKSGTSYYFWTPDGLGSCTSAWYPAYGAYAGRLYQIIGRNRNTFITFLYSWDNGNSAAGGKISQVQAQTESGMTATLSFADVSGHRLLQQIVFPDGATSVTYGYDASGNLTTVCEPPNNGAGVRPCHAFGYQAVGTGSVIYWVSNPRWTGTDGGYTVFGIGGASTAASTVNGIATVAVLNPTIPDGTGSGPLQSGYTTDPSGVSWEYFGTGISSPWFHDTNGHSTNWVVDSVGRPTQTQECTATSGWTCTGQWLITNESWDSANNLVSETDPRGNETDYIHDPAGNTTAVGEPSTATSQGTFKPVRIFDYDAYNNVVGYCDESESRAANANWVTGAASVNASDSLCATNVAGVPHWHATYAYPSYEPYGELASMTTPLGYTRTYAYAAGQQAGADYGLPTSITGAAFTQADGTSIAPTQTFWYDAAGYLRCYSKGVGTSVLTYDALGRIVSVADPDDSSANAGAVCGKTSGQPGWNTQVTNSYFPNGALQSSQTSAQRAGGVATSYIYDADGNTTSETHHYGCTPGGSCTAGVTTKWYDGADRLVEVGLPHDVSDYYSSAWLTRYLYDLSAGGSVSLAGTSYRAYGNLFKTQEWVPAAGASSPSWVDLRGSAYDALDRIVTKYTFSPGSATVRATTMLYDATTATLGELTSTTDPLGETTTYAYDPAGHTTAVSFSGDGGVTPNKIFAYDANGRETSVYGAVYGTETTRYDGDGRAVEIDEPTTGSMTSPAQKLYDYYPNGDQKAVNVVSSAITASPLMSYSYRADGERTKIHVGYGQQQGDFIWTYTDGGRPLTMSDPYTGVVMPSPMPPVAAGTTYPATSWSYDSNGQSHVLRLPETFAYTYTHDDEGHVNGWTAPWSGGTSTMSYVNTVRGENVSQTLTGGYIPWRMVTANGAALRYTFNKGSSSVPQYTIDPANAVVSASAQEVYVPLGANGDPHVDCGLQTKHMDYDAAARLVSTTTTVTGGTGDPNCWAMYDAGPDVTPLYSYDAENHHTVVQPADGLGTTYNVSWDPSGRAYNTGSILHYDGDTILFVTTAAGALSQVKIEALADIDSAGHLTVLDRDHGGQRVTEHDNIAYGAIGLGSNTYRTTSQASIPMVFPGSNGGRGCSGGACPRTGDLEYNRTEGFDLGALTMQGARAVDNTSGQWTTPDADAGDEHDPMSQKAFMWDRNNPYQYEDPSGFFPQALFWEPGQSTRSLPMFAPARKKGTNKKPDKHGGKDADKPRVTREWPAKMGKEDLPDSYEPPKGGPRQNRQGDWVDRYGNSWHAPDPGERHGAPHWDVSGKQWQRNHPERGGHNVPIRPPDEPSGVKK